MGHIISGHNTATMDYFMNKLKVTFNNGIYDPGPFAGSNSEKYGREYLPSKYAMNNNLEDFADTFREVVVSAYLASPDNELPQELDDARSEYDATGIGNPAGVPFKHSISERRAVMIQIITGKWDTIRHE
jgi:hypothetical protein